MSSARYLIVNGDDFGQTIGTTEGIIRAHAHGVLTSTSLMVRWPAAEHAANYAKQNPALDVGLHFDFGEWQYDGDRWSSLYEVVPVEDEDALQVEALSQLYTFRRLIGRNPTHLDSHQHVHRLATVRRVLTEFASVLDVPLRECTAIRYSGDFYGQDEKGRRATGRVSTAALIAILSGLPPGITELACHPSSRDDVDSMYRTERLEELATLCDERVKAAIAEFRIELKSFAELAPLMVQHA